MNAKNHVYRHLGLMAIGQIGNKDVQDMVFALAAQGLSKSMVNKCKNIATYKYYRGLEALKQGKHFDPRDLAQEVGHANLRTMYEIYTHLSLRADANASRRFEDLDEF